MPPPPPAARRGSLRRAPNPRGGYRPTGPARAASGAGASTTTASAPPPNPNPPPASPSVEDLQTLLAEVAAVARSNGAAGPRRTLQAGLAAADVGRALLRGELDPARPEAVLRRLFERLGATYIKLGQFVASSPTLFPPEYVAEFQKCLDRADPVPYEQIRRIVAAELRGEGLALEDVFARVDPVPLATASIAQVHAAELRASGKPVVLKVLKPGVADVLQADLDFLYVAARVVEFLSPELARTSAADIVGDIRQSMSEEVDFTKEAANIEAFARFLGANEGLLDVATAPFVYRQFSTRRLLTMERLEGVPLVDPDSLRGITPEPEAVLINALNTWFASVLLCDVFHADVHAGNLLVLRDGRVGFIDFGIVGRISPVTWGAVQQFLAAFQGQDFPAMARALAQMGATGETVDLDAFAADLAELFRKLDQLDAELVVNTTTTRAGTTAAAGLAVDQAQLNRVTLDLIRVGETHGLKFPREFGLLLKQLLYFDRYVQLLAPGLDVVGDERLRIG